MNELESLLAKIFRDWGSEINFSEREALAKKAAKYQTVDSWRNEHLAYVTTSGIAAGITGGWWSVAAIGADLTWCRKVAPQACLGIGYICGREVDYSQDMNHIMAIWTDTATVSNSLPPEINDDENFPKATTRSAIFTGGSLTGKIGVKASPKIAVKLGTKGFPKLAGKAVGKAAGEVTGKILSKTVLKSGSKVVGKMTSKVVDKAVAKVVAKFAAKVGVGWIPLIGGAVSGGINFWLLNGLMDAAYSYYTHNYVIYSEEELDVEYAY
jgi:hypothetical protein